MLRSFGFPRLAQLPVLVAVIALLIGAWAPWTDDRLGTLVLFALVFALARIGWQGAGALLPREGLATRITTAAVIATAAAFIPATLLGHFGALRPALFLTILAVLAVSAEVLATARGSVPEPRGLEPAAERRTRLETALVLGALAAVAGATFDDVHRHRYLPPGAFGFDDTSFHLSTMATWHQRGDLAGLKMSYGDRSTAFYPLGGELASWVLLAPYGDNDFAARWSQLPFFFATLAAIAAVGRRLGLDRRAALLAVLLYATIDHVFPLLALGAGNDHQTAFAALATADGLLLAARRPGVRAGIYAGLAAGLLIGSKYLGVIFLAPLCAVAVLAVALRPGARARMRVHGPVLLLALTLAGAAAGGYGYLRNLVGTGNPLFPQPLRLFGTEILPGRYDGSLSQRKDSPEAAIELPDFLFRDDLFGQLGAPLLAPAALLAPLAALLAAAHGRRRPATWRREVTHAAVLALPALFFLEFLFLVGDHRDSRYLFPAMALAAIGAAGLLPRLHAGHPHLRSVATALLCVALTWTVASRLGGTASRWLPVLALLVALATATGVAHRVIAGWQRRRLRIALASLLALALLGIAAGKVERYAQHRLDHLPAAAALEREVGPRGATVAYLGFNKPYLFWGSRLQNRVEQVPRSQFLAERLFTWNGSPIDPFQGRGKFRYWYQNLRQLQVRFVVVERGGGEVIERGWLRARPERFQRRYADSQFEIWQLTAGNPGTRYDTPAMNPEPQP